MSESRQDQIDDDLRKQVMEHSFRLSTYDRLLEEQSKKMASLEAALVRLTDRLDKATNRLIFAMIAIVVLGENAMPFLLKLTGT